MAQGMCVYLMIRRKKTTIFTDAKETTNVSDLKKIIQGTNIGLNIEMFFRLNYTSCLPILSTRNHEGGTRKPTSFERRTSYGRQPLFG